jgi:predicted nucleic acid-binding protein
MTLFLDTETTGLRVTDRIVGIGANSWLDLFPAAVASEDTVRIAIQRATDGQVSYWDALLIATAAAACCTAIVTEDLADGSVLNGVHVVHPFGETELPDRVRSLLSADQPL